MKPLHDQRGLALPELLVSISLLIVVIGATLAPFEGYWRTNKRNERQNEAQDRARQTVDRLARELRMGAGAPQLVEKNGGSDLVIQTVDGGSSPSGGNTSNRRRVRYCLDGARTLWRQTHTWTTATPSVLPATTACPGAPPWSAGVAAVEGVANGAGAIFTYDSATTGDVGQVNMDLWIDIDPSRPPQATKLKTGVVLRNRNKQPVATFTATATGNGHVYLDASDAYDPEGGQLTYRWCTISGCDDSNKIGTGETFDYDTGTTGSMSFYLQVFDTGGVKTEAGPQTVNVS
jgi:type II secretory pathway component PulJ